MPKKLFAERNAKAYELFVLMAALLLMLFLWMYLKAEITGHAVVSLKAGQHYAHQIIAGTIDLNIEDGEFMPAQTIVKAEIAEEEESFTLEELIAISGAGIEKKQENFSVKNVNLTGQGEGYSIEGGGIISFNLSDFNLKVEEEGKYDLVISLEYDDVVILTEQKKINIKTCVPNWKQKNTSCSKNDTLTAYYTDTKKCYSKTNLTLDLEGKPENATLTCDYCKLNLTQYNTTCSINDTYLVWYKDNNKCYSKTGLESDKVPINTTLACDFCTPNWTAVNTSCLPGDMIITWYNDSNECFSITNLTSDLQGRQNNATHKLACDYEGNNILGNISNINTTIKNLALFIAKSSDLTKSFTDLQEIIIKENGSELLEFNFNLSLAKLNLANLIIQKQAENETKGFISVKGINLTAQNKTKTIWIDRLANGASVCVKDEENIDVESISYACNSSNEFFVKCPGSNLGYVCEFDASLGKYKVSGLRHSAVIEQEAFCGDAVCNADETCSSCSDDCGGCPPQLTAGGGGSGGGTAGGGCTPKWECSEWGVCVNGKQKRTCTNLKAYCPINKPVEQQECQVQEKPEEISKPTENITIPETQPTTEKPQARGNIISAVVGVFGVLPGGLKIAVLVQILTLIIILVIALTFLRIVIKGKKFEQVPITSQQSSTAQPSKSAEQNQQSSQGSQTSNSSSSNEVMPDTE